MSNTLSSMAVASRWLRDRLAARLWLFPAAATALAFGGARLIVHLDHRIEQEKKAWFLFGGEAESARELLSTIASSMMTFTGLVFSITILVLQLASSQFSPRVLSTFLADRTTHAAMASFVGTFVFSMALLPEVRSGDASTQFVPALSVFVAFVLVLVSVGVFIRYIDRMAQSIRAISILRKVGDETRESIERMFPEKCTDAADPFSDPLPAGPPHATLDNDGHAGVLSSVDEAKLMAIARETDSVVAVVPMPGDFLTRRGGLFRVWRRGAAIAGTDLPEARMRGAVLIADERTPHQDPAFGLRQLVDIAERALSPGINDPSTAVQALDQIHDLLRTLVVRRIPGPSRFDDDGTVRLFLPRPDWDAYVGLALDEIRQYGSGSVQVLRRIRALLEDCLDAAPPARRPALQRQMRLLDEAVDRGLARVERPAASTPSSQGHGPA